MISALARFARNRFHNARAELLLKLIPLTPGMSVLDLGSGWSDPFIRRVAARIPLDVTLADISEGPTHDARRFGFRAVLLEEGKPLPFHDRQFDLVVSNSVIEHTTAPKQDCLNPSLSEAAWAAKAKAGQRAFADEIRRVGKQYFVQTPHRNFPLDLHLWLPFTNWLSHRATRRLVLWTDRFWIKHNGIADWNLLGTADVQALFPEAKIHVERVLGVPKSIIAYAPADYARARD